MAVFERAEYRERLAKTKQRMELAGIDLLIVSEPGNMAYLSGYESTSYYARQFVIVSTDDDEPLWVGREWTDGVAAAYTTFMDPSRVIGYPEERLSDPVYGPMEFVADLVTDRGWDRQRIGMELGGRSLPYADGARFRARLPNATIVNADALVDRVRVVKSDAEITLMREAGRIGDRAMSIGLDAVERGVRQCDVAAKLLAALVEGLPEYGGHFPEGLVLTSGEQVSAIHSHWSDRPFRDGELTNIELGGCRHGYNVGLTRSVVTGQPSAGLMAREAAYAEAFNVAVELLRPGVTCHDVQAAFHRVVTGHGFEARPRPSIGYSIGLGFAGLDWTEDAANLGPGDQTVLEPNMTLHLICPMRLEHGGWGLLFSETFQVIGTGRAESFSTLPRGLTIKA
jgi:Xaa-Pro dipeptidase